MRLLAVAALVGAALAVYQAFAPAPAGRSSAAVGALPRRRRRRQRSTPASSSASSSRPTSRCARRRSSCTTSTATRAAFALDRVEERELSGDALADARRHRRATRRRSRTCGSGTTSRCSTRSARSRRSAPTTTSSSVDNDRYTIDGEYRQVMLSARELNSREPAEPHLDQRAPDLHARLRPDARPGQPGDARRAAGPVHQGPAAGVDGRPEGDASRAIYFGELSNDHVFVKTRHAGVPLPEGDDNVFTHVRRATAACRVGSVLRAGCCSRIRFRSIDRSCSATTSRRESRVLFHRRIARARRARSRRSCTFDRDPYLAIADGRLFWIQDAYTTSDRYPYSTPRARRHQLHPQLGQGRRSTPTTARRRSTWPTRRIRSRRRSAKIFPGLLQAARRDAGGPAHAPALPGGHLRAPGGDVRDVPHDEPGGLLQPGRPVGDAGDRRSAGRPQRDAALLHDHEAAGRDGAPSSSRCCRSRRGRRTTSPPGWSRAATASTTASSSCSSSRSRRWSSARGRSWRASTRIRRSRRRSRCGTSRAREVIQGTLLVIPIEESLHLRPAALPARPPAGGSPS